MDSLVVEAPDAADCTLQEGDWVEVFGANLSVDEVAQQAETIALRGLYRLRISRETTAIVLGKGERIR
jgi:alanine racemase